MTQASIGMTSREAKPQTEQVRRDSTIVDCCMGAYWLACAITTQPSRLSFGENRAPKPHVTAGTLLDLDVGVLHHLCPPGLFGADKGSELVRRVGAHLSALPAEVFAHLRQREDAADVGVETRNDVTRRALRGDDALP